MWNSIFLPSTTSPPKDLRPKPSPLSRAIFGRYPRPPHLFFTGWSEWPKEEERAAGFYTWGICRGGWWLSLPYKSQHRGWLVSEPPLQIGAINTGPFLGAAQSPAAPTNAPHIKQMQLLLPPRVTHSNPWKKGGEAMGTSQKLLY